MKNILRTSFFIFLTTIAVAQNEASLLVNKVWKIKSDEMSGVGIHNSLAVNTELQFFSDGTWKSSQPIKENTSGTWKLENNRTLVMKIGNEETKYLLLQVTKNELQYRLKKNAATYTYTWSSKDQ